MGCLLRLSVEFSAKTDLLQEERQNKLFFTITGSSNPATNPGNNGVEDILISILY